LINVNKKGKYIVSKRKNRISIIVCITIVDRELHI